ncbi:hypothetical protein Vretimale_3580 [Volvox reticuliferus]|uniref:Uncharacterized protein n=1 Tax=Volvox reticuliferus TaxID=1737510 RepID=A0A8J4BX58_9CHLO|nr:hypothetical protein Vretifemale_1163 [Volvox reticuliferus]GIL98115.1 hypothetical protein Vretimale_3580 [Volvox reticuliferus]
MASYWGFRTEFNIACWILFGCCLITGAVMLPLGWSKLMPCIKTYNSCVDRNPYLETYCRTQRDQCGANWARIWIAGAIMLAAATVPLCVFSCCSRPPREEGNNPSPIAVAVQLPISPGASVYPQDAYPQYPPASGQPYAGTTVIGQPVIYPATPQNGQAVAYYPMPPEPVRGPS